MGGNVNASITDSNGDKVDPREETSDHRTGSAVELDSASGGGDATESLTVPGRPDSVRILVKGAEGTYDVTVSFSNTSVVFGGDSTTDVDEERAVMDNGTVDVTIGDTSGVSNTVSYDILLV